MKRLALLVTCLLLVLPAAPAQAAGSFTNPLNGSADPTLTYYNGNYYLATTLGDRIGIWKSPTLAGLKNAPENTVFRDPDNSRNKQVWAPALYRFGERWYIYYTASDGVDANHRNYVIESDGLDPLGPYHFKARIADWGTYAIDGEPFVHNGQMYFAWAGPGRGMGGPAQIYLQKMNSPWTVTGNRLALPASGGCTEVREGPVGLKGPGRLFLVYSTCDTGKPDYQLWMKSIADGADPLVPGNWLQHAGPVFWRNDAAGVFGPGHNGFFKSPDGSEDWIVYHGKTSSAYTYAGRTTRAQKISWNGDGTPNFGRPYSLGTALTPPAGDPDNPSTGWSSIVDNTTEGRFTASANWGTSSYSAQRYGPDYRYASPVAASDAAWYKFAIPETGNYRVEVWWPALPGYNSSAPHVIVTATGNVSVHVDQRVNGGTWRTLGTFTLTAGDENKVAVSRWTNGTGLVIADAIRITRV
ncbi:family 43 glycosylhydrolase [Catelliglobosispora koreensis]|uniref:family 43 glycosylhydrolase n=1 Tax=Catelliglobosispora koreensis TaxID=129052 RepID=UPI000375E215|nr:family 43 glycosylhydrolase [Catelliglobosispora koreensis]